MPNGPSPFFVSDRLRIDFVRAAAPSTRLLFTFTEFGNRDLDGLGFAGKFAVDTGFDLVAIKANANDWYASVPDEAFSALEAGLAAHAGDHAWRGCFGSSMGAYAALLFAARLRADVALAYSPQFDISQPWDGRWRRYAPHPQPFRTLDRRDLSTSCRYVVVYDPYDTDGRHAREYAAVIPGGSLELLTIPYAGHPVGPYLKATGHLKALPTAAFAGAGLARAVVSAGMVRRKGFEDYFFNLAGHCLRRGKLRAARKAIQQAQLRKPWHPEVLIRAAQIDERLGQLHAAAAWAALAVTVSRPHPHYSATFARILHKGGRHSEALHQIGIALSLVDKSPPFEAQRHSILASLAGKPPTPSRGQA